MSEQSRSRWRSSRLESRMLGTSGLLVLIVLTATDAVAQQRSGGDPPPAEDWTRCGVSPQDVEWYGQDHPETFWFRDLGYFKPLRADIRAPRTYFQFIRADTVPRNGLGGDDFSFGGSRNHLEGGWGAEFPLVGRHWRKATGTACRGASGFQFFIHASVHTMSDLGSENDVVNSDDAFGVSLVLRPRWKPNRLAFRLRLIHESTHLGDEFSVIGTVEHGLERFDVAYEALDLYVLFDNAETATTPYQHYWRAYGGLRRLGQGSTLGPFDGEAEGFKGAPDGAPTAVVPVDPLRYKSRFEYSVGGEALSGQRFSGTRFTGHLFAAAELYVRSRLDRERPTTDVNVFAGLGWIFRNPSVRDWGLEFSVRFYNGIHPHGQFRAIDGFRYWAWRIAFNPT